jgi:outer membrane protein OmpA-like peptidoglycan-associated protein/tetratricopeptide (TPR) repeat protein
MKKVSSLFHSSVKSSIFLLLMLALALALPQTTFGQKAKLDIAEQYFQAFDFRNAENIYSDILASAKHANDTLPLRRIAYCQTKIGQWVKAEANYKRLIAMNVGKPTDFLGLAEVLKLQGKYSEAIDVYAKLIAVQPLNAIAKTYLNNKDFAEKIERDSAIYKLRCADVNSSNSDFGPGFFVNGQLVFASSRGDGSKHQAIYNWNNQPFLNMYICDIAPDSSLKNAQPISTEVTSRLHEGTMAYYPGSNTFYYTKENLRKGDFDKVKGGRRNLGIYSVKYNVSEKTYDEERAFEFNNRNYSLGNPTLTPDGKRMYFVSDMPGGLGGTDLYYSQFNDSTWTAPVNCGAKINTIGDELFPFAVSSDVLYFSSNGHLSIGGLDVFYTNPNDSSVVKNIGYPGNSHYDDFALVCFPNETRGYLSSNRPGGKGDDDIYEFTIRPVEEVFVSGIVKDQNSLDPVANAIVMIPTEDGSMIQVKTDNEGRYVLKVPYKDIIELEANKQGYLNGKSSRKADPRSSVMEGLDINLQKIDWMTSGKVIYDKDGTAAIGAMVILNELIAGDTLALDTITITSNASYMWPLAANKTYLTIAIKEGFSRMTEKFSTNNPAQKVHSRDFKLFKLEKNTTVKVDNIYYDYNSAVLKPESATELNKLVGILRDNPSMRIELGSHSDSRGGDAYNLTLSEKRAKSAVDYLVGQGVAKERMVSKGYGETILLNQCDDGVTCTDEQHAVNRRTEFKVL